MPRVEWEEIEAGRVGDVVLVADGTFRWGEVEISATSVILSQLEVGSLVCGGGILVTTFTLPDGHVFKYNKWRRQWYRYVEGPDQG
jgi:hypothetical protein